MGLPQILVLSIADTIPCQGVLAQLVERFLSMEEAVSSILTHSSLFFLLDTVGAEASDYNTGSGDLSPPFCIGDRLCSACIVPHSVARQIGLYDSALTVILPSRIHT